MSSVMPRRSRLKLPPLNLGKETLGQRLVRFRKERGLTQKQLAEKIGIIEMLISDYERDKLRLHAEMVIRYAKALGVTTDELLGVKRTRNAGYRPSLKVVRRVKKIEQLEPGQQRALLRTIDTFLKGAKAG